MSTHSPQLELHTLSLLDLLDPQIVLNENSVLEELSVEYVPQIGFFTTLHERFGDLAPDDFTFAFAQVGTDGLG